MTQTAAASEKNSKTATFKSTADQCQSQHQRPRSASTKHKWNVVLRNFFAVSRKLPWNVFSLPLWQWTSFNARGTFSFKVADLWTFGVESFACDVRIFSFRDQPQRRFNLRNWELTQHTRTDPPLLWNGKILIRTDTPKPVTSILLSSQTRPQRRRGKKSKAYVEACWWCFKYS